jgi:diguanylate cyclase (GGDEF)-like protein/PAS domain S-box-containing protein
MNLNNTRESVKKTTPRFRLEKRELLLDDIFYSLSNIVADAIIVTDSRRRIVYFNKAAEKMFGYISSDIMGRSASHILPQDILSFNDKVKSRTKDKFFEVLGRKKSGEKIALGISASGWESEKGAFTTLILRDISEKKSAEEKLLYLSFHDNLTGIYNRSYFDEELQRLNTTRQLPLSVLIGDIDGFKLVNDAFGYKQGDELLKSTAKILKDSCRAEDILARWGGDEFVILLPKTDINGVQEIISRIESKSRQLASGEIPLNISLGYAIKEKPSENIYAVVKKAEDLMKQKKLIQSKKVSNAIISSIKKKLSAKSFESAESAERIKKLALDFAKFIKLPKPETDNLALLADFHNIGKVAIKKNILKKKSKLAESEWQIMKMHPEIGFRIAKSSTQLSQISDAILAHHENWDGTGYPYRIKGSKIPLISRIIAIVEAYDAMVCGRAYKKSVNSDEAMRELKRFARKQFDPVLVSKFIEMMQKRQENLSLFS